MKKAFLLAALIGVSAPVLAQTYDFDTNQSASFTTTMASSTNDAAVNYSYDYATHTQFNGPAVTIPSAPNSTGGTTLGARLTANTVIVPDAVDIDAINIYPNISPSLGANYEMTFDLWFNYNGGALGGTGSTYALLFGATDATTVAPKYAAGPFVGTGYIFTLTGEGGAAQDYRLYNGTGSIANVTTTSAITWFARPGTDVTAPVPSNNTSADWGAFFDDPATSPPPSPPGVGVFETFGAPGKQWVSVKLAVNGTAATVSFKRPGDSGFTAVGTATVVTGATRPFIGYSDVNTTQNAPVGDMADQFAVIDNLSIANTASVEAWTIYN